MGTWLAPRRRSIGNQIFFRALSLLLFAVLGADVAAWVRYADGGRQSLIVLAVIGAVLSLWLSLAVGIAASFRVAARMRAAVSPDDPDYAERAAREGRVGIGRVLSLAETGAYFGRNPVCRLLLVVVPRSGPTYQVTTELLVSVIQAPRVQPGCLVPMVTYADGRQRVVLSLSATWPQRAAQEQAAAIAPVPAQVAPDSIPATVTLRPAGRNILRLLPVHLMAAAVGAAAIITANLG
jgi:hypothetical protein